MCGILVHNFNKIVANQLFHRGPDAYGVKKINNWYFHHNRLIVKDLSDASQQPFSLDGASYLLYNGEIYNDVFLKEKHFSNIEFNTAGDTELLYRILETKKYHILDEIDGIFAFVFYDGAGLVYGRDPFGVKPLFRIRYQDKIGLSSEISPLDDLHGLKTEVDFLPELIKYKFVGDTNTIYKNIEKVPPGTLTMENSLGVKELKYTTLFDRLDENIKISDDELNQMVGDAVQSQLRADVSVGMQLSGGVDSTLMSRHVSRKIPTFCSIFSTDYPWDERGYVEQVCDAYDIKCDFVQFSSGYFEKNLGSVFYRRGGLSHPHTSAIEQIAQEASRHVKVLLSGEGADEVFLGYNRYLNVKSEQDIIDNGKFFSKTELNLFFNWSKDFDRQADLSRSQMISKLNGSKKSKLQMLEFNFHLANLLERQDLATMKYSIEGRIPFLSQNLTRDVLRLSEDFLVQSTGKLPLKRLVERDFGPEFAFRNKIGFRVPLNEWMYSRYCYNMVKAAISNSDLVNSYIKKEVLNDIVHRRGIYENELAYGKLFWTILNLSNI